MQVILPADAKKSPRSPKSDPPLPKRRASRLGVVAIVVGLLVVAVLAYVVFGSSEPEKPPPVTTQSTSSTVEEAESVDTSDETAVEVDEPDEYTGSGDDAWNFNGDRVPEFIDTPLRYEPGTVEGDVEVAYVNASIAGIRALANPDVEEPELTYWRTGFALKASRDLMAISIEERTRSVPGPIDRVEIENVRLVDDQTADIEICALESGFTYFIDDPDPDNVADGITSWHGVMRLVKGPEGQWQVSERISTIFSGDGFAACLDLVLEDVPE